MTKPGRIACEIPFCRRTAPAEKYGDDAQIICGKCWRLADPATRRENRRLYRLADPSTAEIDAFDTSWEAIKAQITEAKGGIA
jgi:hypothetical protein